jgi:hypothetical protein
VGEVGIRSECWELGWLVRRALLLRRESEAPGGVAREEAGEHGWREGGGWDWEVRGGWDGSERWECLWNEDRKSGQQQQRDTTQRKEARLQQEERV